MRKAVELKEETALLLNKARAKFIDKYPKIRATDNNTIAAALKYYLGV